jgi:hypothetical protein
MQRASSQELDALRIATGRLEALARADVQSGDLHAAEFRVFSQWNEDGVIQHLLRHVPVRDRTFVEFGVDDYREANTRFLLMNDGWQGLVLDDGDAHRRFVYEESELGWRYPIDARSAFLSRESINDALGDAGYDRDLGLLSIDVDGMDYWIWDAIEAVLPRIVVIEFNSLFGCEHAVTVPYDSAFNYATAHPSHLYYGASLPALVKLGERKGYQFVGCESHGANAFFVRNDIAAAGIRRKPLPQLARRRGTPDVRRAAPRAARTHRRPGRRVRA